MNVFINLLAAAALVSGFVFTHYGDSRLGCTMFSIALPIYVLMIVTEKRNAGNRFLDAIMLILATLGVASTAFMIRYEAAKLAAGL